MIDIIKVKEGKKKVLKFKLNKVEKEWIVDEIFYAQNYFPRISKELDFKINKNDIVIDIGANVGIFSLCAANLAYKGKVYALEPVKENFERLLWHKALNKFNNIVAENKGVSDKRKKAKIYLIEKNSGGHSMDKRKFALLDENIVGTEIIECITLKSIFDKYKIKKCDFLKLDCEGEEYKILKALPSRYFERIDKISLEFHKPVVDEIELAKILIKQGFKVTISNYGNTLGMIFARRKTKKK